MPTCFVIMGFGEKTDYRTQRKLNLDKTYRIINKSVEAAGLECIRADEIIHAGVIDKPMYEQLLQADFVIADLSTSNENAIYELGVRHALRPNTTIVIAESQFKFPFDLNSVVIRTYQHLGVGIDFEEADKLADSITTTLRALIANQDVDSPVYTFLPGLQPPSLASATALPCAADTERNAGSGAENTAGFSALLDSYHIARADGDFACAGGIIAILLKAQPDDPYLIQQSALTTYKSRQPDPITALESARDILLDKLAPHETNDPETLGLWGAIHKRLWEELQQASALDEAITAYGRGFFLRRDYYNGINYAFMLNVRSPLQASQVDAVTDCVLATRVRHQLLKIIDQALRHPPRRAEDRKPDPQEVYWLEASRLEALVGLARQDQLAGEKARIYALAPEPWMQDSTEEQLQKLQLLLDQVQPVLGMPYPEFVASVRQSEAMSNFSTPG